MVKNNDNQPHIAFYLHGLYGGGAERVIVNLANNFAQQGIKVDIVVNYLKGPYVSQVSSEVRLVNLKASRLRDGFGLPQLIKYLKNEEPCALLATTHYSTERAIIAKKLAKVSTKVVVREANTLSSLSQNERRLRWRFMASATKIIYPFADDIIAVCEGVADDLTEMTGINREKITVIYNPSITPTVLKKSEETIDHPWFKTGQPPVILGIGRLTKQKDFPTLIKAFAEVKKVKNARLMILGEARDKVDREINILIKHLGLEEDVALVGFVENPYPYIAYSTVFVSSSRWEGLSNVLIEAMALKAPLVATDCPGGSAEILGHGKYGELVAVADSCAMAQAILKVLDNSIKPVESTWLDKFKMETVSKKYLKILLANEQISKSKT